MRLVDRRVWLGEGRGGVVVVLEAEVGLLAVVKERKKEETRFLIPNHLDLARLRFFSPQELRMAEAPQTEMYVRLPAAWTRQLTSARAASARSATGRPGSRLTSRGSTSSQWRRRPTFARRSAISRRKMGRPSRSKPSRAGIRRPRTSPAGSTSTEDGTQGFSTTL